MTISAPDIVTLDAVRRAAERIGPHAVRTPLLRQWRLKTVAGNRLHLKAENLQRGGAFKFRGAYNVLAVLAETENPSRVITSSSGNHGQAVAAAGQLLGMDITVVMPENAVAVKAEAVRGYGATVEFAGTTSFERQARASEIGQETGGVVIGSFDDARIIAGQGTAGLEIVEDLPEVDVIIVPVGGGGLISGIATAVKAVKPACRIIGVEPAGAADAHQSLLSGHIVTLSHIATIADGLRTSSVGRLNFAIMSRLVDEIALVDDADIRSAMRALAFEANLTVEPSGAVAVAALLTGKVDVAGQTVVALISGGNVDPRMYAEILAQ